MMEKISRDLEVAKARKEKVMEACRKVNAESSAVLLSCVQLNNLEEHFDGIQKAMEARVTENVERERLLEERERRIVAGERRSGFLQEEICRREVELENVEKRIKACTAESKRWGRLPEDVRRKEEELRIAEKRLKNCKIELARSHEDLDRCLSVLKDRKVELESVRRLFVECCEEYDRKNIEVEALSDRAAKLEAISKDYVLKKDMLNSINLDIKKKVVELHDKERQQEVLRNSINEQLAEFNVRKQEFDSLECSCKRIAGELQDKECELERGMLRLDELEKKIKSKNEELVSVQGSIAGLSESLDVKKGELQAKECELEQGMLRLEELEKKIKSKNEELASVKSSIAGLSESLDVKKGEHSTICSKIDKKNMELARKEEELDVIRVRTKRWEEDLQVKERKASCLRKIIRERLDDIEDKKSQLSFVKKSLSRSSEELEYRKKELEEIRLESTEYLWELEKREKGLDLLLSSLDERCKLLEINERAFEEKVRMDLECRPVQLKSREKSREYSQEVGLTPGSKVVNRQGQIEVKWSEVIHSGHSPVKAMISPGITSIGRKPSDDEFLVWKLHGRDPWTEVLDIIKEALESCRENVSSDIRLRHIYLLERMKQNAPPPLDGIQERALEIARVWESKLRIRVEGRLEALSFLLLLDVYKLASFFDRHETANLAETFSLNDSCPELCEAVGLANTNAAWTDARQRLQSCRKRRERNFDRS